MIYCFIILINLNLDCIFFSSSSSFFFTSTNRNCHVFLTWCSCIYMIYAGMFANFIYTVLVYAGIIIFMPSEFKSPGRYALSSKFNGRHKSLANFFNLQRSYKKTPTLYFINCLRSYRYGSFSTAQMKSQFVSYPPKTDFVFNV